jgi:hypothetical protein
MKYVFLALSLLAANVHATEIDAVSGTFNISNATGTNTQTCERILFLKRNTGAVASGLKTANLKLYSATHISETTSATSGKATNSIMPTYSLTPATTQVGVPTPTPMSGVYDLCIRPFDFTWTIKDVYEFRFLVNGLTAADNGSLIFRLQN